MDSTFVHKTFFKQYYMTSSVLPLAICAHLVLLFWGMKKQFSGMPGQTGPQGLGVPFDEWAQCELETFRSFQKEQAEQYGGEGFIMLLLNVCEWVCFCDPVFWFLISSFLMKPSGVQLICIGSCGLHTLHNALKCGFTAWQLDKLLRAMYTLFHNVPARRED